MLEKSIGLLLPVEVVLFLFLWWNIRAGLVHLYVHEYNFTEVVLKPPNAPILGQSSVGLPSGMDMGFALPFDLRKSRVSIGSRYDAKSELARTWYS